MVDASVTYISALVLPYYQREGKVPFVRTSKGMDCMLAYTKTSSRCFFVPYESDGKSSTGTPTEITIGSSIADALRSSQYT
jgi:hypothetical protein